MSKTFFLFSPVLLRSNRRQFNRIQNQRKCFFCFFLILFQGPNWHGIGAKEWELEDGDRGQEFGQNGAVVTGVGGRVLGGHGTHEDDSK